MYRSSEIPDDASSHRARVEDKDRDHLVPARVPVQVEVEVNKSIAAANVQSIEPGEDQDVESCEGVYVL